MRHLIMRNLREMVLVGGRQSLATTGVHTNTVNCSVGAITMTVYINAVWLRSSTDTLQV